MEYSTQVTGFGLRLSGFGQYKLPEHGFKLQAFGRP